MTLKERDQANSELVSKWNVRLETVRTWHDARACAVLYSYRRRGKPAGSGKTRQEPHRRGSGQLDLFTERGSHTS